MRRRSGAIHSESEEEFMMLAEQCVNKTGLFYDDNMNRESSQPPKQETPSNSNPFANFDFSPEKEFEKDSKQQELQSAINITYVLICDETGRTCDLLSQPEPDLQKQSKGVEHRPIDLVVRRGVDRKGHEVVFKYWVVEAGIMESPLAQIYISSSKKQFWCSESANRLPTATAVDSGQLLQTIEASETQFCAR